MKEFSCIVCPRSCLLTVSEDENGIHVSGNTCNRGRDFAVSEVTAPKRTLCSTVKTAFPQAPVLPVRVSAEIPKEKIFDVMKEINKLTLERRVARGDTVIENVLGLGVDVISTSDLLKHI